MKLSEFKSALALTKDIQFQFPSGEKVAPHAHLTEVGGLSKHFIDCGGTVRIQNKVSFQLWEATDFDHRLDARKLLGIIDLSESTLGLGDHEIQVEFQGTTIETYALGWDGNTFRLESLFTDCLAKEQCGIPEIESKSANSEARVNNESVCAPGSGCC